MKFVAAVVVLFAIATIAVQDTDGELSKFWTIFRRSRD